jgi:hypothetical protein
MAVKSVTYKNPPSVEQWRNDSSVTFATRKNDVILTRIDSLMEALWKAPDAAAQLFVGCDLFFSLDYWLKIAKNNPKMEKERQPAIQALYEWVVGFLCRSFNVTVNVLPRELEYMFGREMGDHGSKLDQEWDCARYLTRAEAKKYRLWFKKGKAYQFPWWDKSKSFGADFGKMLTLAESDRAHNPAVISQAKFGGFAMSMGRDFYLARHHCGGIGQFTNHYHSSYLAGNAVMCAGTMLIEGGVIKCVRTDSGHYQPTDAHLLNVLQAFQMVQVPLSTLYVENYNGTMRSRGTDFLASQGNWNTVMRRKQANFQHIQSRVDSKNESLQLYDFWANSGYPTWAQMLDVLVWWYGWDRNSADYKLRHAVERHDTVPKGIQADRLNRLGPLPLKP